MHLRYITFPDRETEARGLVEVAQRVRIDALPDGVYVVNDVGIAVLREMGIPFEDAREGELPVKGTPATRPWSQL